MTLRLLFIICSTFFLANVASAAGSSAPPEEVEEEVGEFLPIEPISVAMYNKRKRPAGTMTVIMQLHIEDKDQMKEAIKIMPRLKNAYMQETLKLALNFFEISRPVNANLLGRSLQNVTNMVLKHDKARVLIGDIAIQKR